jgi:hypothetical protein
LWTFRSAYGLSPRPQRPAPKEGYPLIVSGTTIGGRSVWVVHFLEKSTLFAFRFGTDSIGRGVDPKFGRTPSVPAGGGRSLTVERSVASESFFGEALCFNPRSSSANWDFNAYKTDEHFLITYNRDCSFTGTEIRTASLEA